MTLASHHELRADVWRCLQEAVCDKSIRSEGAFSNAISGGLAALTAQDNQAVMDEAALQR